MADDIKSQISEAMKKVVLTGVGTIFMTEETVRTYLGELKLPKEMWSGFIENATKTKQEFLTTFAKEAAQVLGKVDFANEIKKFLEQHHMKVSIEVRFDAKDGAKVSAASASTEKNA